MATVSPVPVGPVQLEADAPAATEAFTSLLGVQHAVGVRSSDAPTSGVGRFTLSLVVPGPSPVDALLGAALAAGGTALKPAAKSFWGYGGVIRAPDGSIWKVATSSKKDPGPVTTQVDSVVLLLGVADVGVSKRFYVERGLAVDKSFGAKFVQFATPSSPVGLGRYGRRALAEDAGVPVDGTGSHRLVVGGGPGSSTDPDGFVWETTAVQEAG